MKQHVFASVTLLSPCTRVSALTSAEHQKTTQLEAAKQAVQALRADKIVLEDRLAKAAAEQAASKRAEETVKSLTEDLKTVKDDLKQRDIRSHSFYLNFFGTQSLGNE